jgi:chromosome segregation ATPase
MAERLGILLGAVPQVAPYILDLYTGSLDVPAAEEISARLRTLVPPEALQATEGGSPESKVAILQNQVQQATQALQALQGQMQQLQQTSEVATQQLALTEQENARLKTQLADKSRDIAVDTQKAKWDHEEAMLANQIKMAEVQAKYGLQAAELQHDLMQPPATNGTTGEEGSTHATS